MEEEKKQAIIDSGKAFFRILTTSFGQNIQTFISSLEEVIGCASGIEGIDIEFIDALDGRRKYCQLKAGYHHLNEEEAGVILGNFKNLIGHTTLDELPFHIDDLIVGVLFGEAKSLSPNLKAINAQYPVYCGAEFWEHLTGDRYFYYRLSKAFGEVVEEENIAGHLLIKEKIEELTQKN